MHVRVLVLRARLARLPRSHQAERGGFDNVATGSYIQAMSELKTVGIRELKNNLSAYLREVRRGTRVLVSDRNRVVAELHEPKSGYAVDDFDDPIHPGLAEWIDSRTLSAPTVKKARLPKSPVRLKDGMADRLLDTDRRETDR